MYLFKYYCTISTIMRYCFRNMNEFSNSPMNKLFFENKFIRRERKSSFYFRDMSEVLTKETLHKKAQNRHFTNSWAQL